MYRVNLYREFFEGRALRRRRLVSLSLLVVLGSLGVLLIAVGVANGILIAERRAALEKELTQSGSAPAGSEASPDLSMAKQLLQLRRERIEWSPKIAALAARTSPVLRLVEVRGEIERKGVPAYLEIQGVVRADAGGTEPVIAFIEGLREDPAVHGDFPEVSLGTLEGEGSGRFRVICREGGGK